MDTTAEHPQLPEDQAPRHRSRRGPMLGAAAGLLGGGAIGLLMTVPSITSAATDETDGTDDTPVEITDEARPEHGERLREALQELVDDGTIDAEQADAVAEHLATRAGEHGGGRHGPHGRHGGPGVHGEVVAEVLGIDAESLRERLRSGESIADIAEENDVDIQLVIDALVAEASEHLDQAIESGRLTEDEAAERLSEITERITEGVERSRTSATPEDEAATSTSDA